MGMMYYQLSKSSYQDFLKILKADIQHANALAAAIPRAKSGAHLQMKLVYTDGRSNISRRGRKATIREFYGVILPSLQRLHSNLGELDDDKEAGGSSAKKRVDLDNRLGNIDFEREDECGICLEPCTKMVLPNCCHAMCIKCYRNWNTKSESCPFCRGSLKRVNSEDLWVLTCNDDVVDNKTVSQEDLLRFYLYINSLPKDFPDALFLVYYEYLI
ncbi:E3 ubiquitin-protein ligase AIRP2 isoform X2 [Gossypium hirsutum]|uniref:E3 ubiquitin-protein ligase AIRP2 isoform X2 n=1 Tax=Gossypium hirsutum TaxID=3635 RepID=A0ABM2ZA76_GOSHI|nr:E3 ubiquitin-protein ligase AIRP2 isoform X2 [Gossypium hirsutum]